MRRPAHLIITTIAITLVMVGCSTKNNTSKSRFWHSFTARYNTYYNGSQAFIDGSQEKEKGNKDNYTELLPLYTVGNKQSRTIGKGQFDRTIEKMEKAIKQHSIKARPEWNKSRRKTEKDREWLGRKEYNPFLWKAWLLMGKAQFQKGEFDESAATFSYMSRLYQTQPMQNAIARAWLAKNYTELGWLYDAEDIIRGMSRDSMHYRSIKDWDYTYADYYLRNGELEQAVPYLRKVIKHETRKTQKAREWFLMGQIQTRLGHREEAYKAYRHVVSQNPPYELEFNARIAQTEVMAESNGKGMISRLRRMARNDNNKDYLDQVYYAIGNIYLLQHDTLHAIGAYEKGNEKSTRNGIEKGVLLLRLGGLYWDKERYADAQRCYGEAIGLLDKDRSDYEELSYRSKVLDELVPYTEAIHLQDSLQELARMPEKERLEAIDRVIEALKKKEKEEADKAREAEVEKTLAQRGNTGRTNNTPTPPTATQQGNGQWYFYNPMTVNQGKQTFQRQWGKRDNADNWRRHNQTVVNLFQDAEDSEASEIPDSLSTLSDLSSTDSIAQSEVPDSVQNDPHNREYYLAQIPFTDEQVEASNDIIKDGLFHAGIIFKDKLGNLQLSERYLLRLTGKFPEFPQNDEAWYHLFLLYSIQGRTQLAENCLSHLKADYPDSQWTILLSDPHFVENARFGIHIEDSLYAATYDAFKGSRYDEATANARLAAERFPLGANQPRFLFISGLSKLNEGDGDGCVELLKQVVEKYPQSEVSEMAGMIVKGVQEGRRLHGGKFDLGDVWSRRDVTMNVSDSTTNDTLSADRNAPFLFIMAYQPDSLNENQLLFELARYNFTNFMVRNFDLQIEQDGELHRMVVSGFMNYDEALQYARKLYAATDMKALMRGCRTLIISQPNLAFIGTRYSYDDYADFYQRTFQPLTISDEQLLIIPSGIDLPDIEDGEDTEDEEDEEPEMQADDFDFGEDFF